jgi:sulfotransferase family protein
MPNQPTAHRPILMTGSHRSGTTWAGAMLCLSEEAAYIDEPFNPGRRPGWAPRPFPHWYQYICPENEARYLPVFRDIFDLRYPLVAQLGQIRSLEHIKRAAGDWSHSIRCRRRRMLPLVKDPIAFMSAKWLADRFGARVVVMVRHPAAFAGSLKRLDWQFDFSEWLEQDLLMRDLLSPFADRIRDFAREKRDIVDQAILMWNVINNVARHYRETNPDWLFVRYEDLAETPVDRFRDLYRQLGLTWNDRIRDLVADHTGTGNVKEVSAADVGTIRRDSRAAKWTWWTRLTEQEIERVRTGVADVAGWFYSDADWIRV